MLLSVLPARHCRQHLDLMWMGWMCCFFPQKIPKFLSLGYWEQGGTNSDFGVIVATAEVSFFVA